MYDESSVFIDQLEENVSLAQEFKSGYLAIFVKIELGDHEILKEFGSCLENECDRLNLFIRKSKKRIQDVRTSDKETQENMMTYKENEKL